MPDIFIARHQDGSETLVTLWGDDNKTTAVGEVATRPGSWATWGLPTPLEVAS